jgi:hypothetical protein
MVVDMAGSPDVIQWLVIVSVACDICRLGFGGGALLTVFGAGATLISPALRVRVAAV